MGILNKILGHDEEAQTMEQAIDAAECPHTALAPHWDSLADMGKKELATYTCESCGRTFNYDQAAKILDHAPTVLTAAGSPDDR
jgi:transposase-like protein